MKNQQIEGLRGVAILIVVVYHLVCRYQQIFHKNDIIFMKHWGEFGVVIFLLISCYFMNGKSNENFSLTDYIKKKIFRLWPCYAVSLTFTFLVVSAYNLPGRTTTIYDYLCNLIWINGFINVPYVDGAYWYLSVILFFSVIIGIQRQKKVSYNIGIHTFFLSIGFLCRQAGMDEMQAFAWVKYAGVMSAGVSLWIKKNQLSIEVSSKKTDVVIITMACVYTLVVSGKLMLLELLIAYILISRVLDRKIRVFETPILRLIGTVSYPLYLIHQNISYVIIHWMEIYFGAFSYWYCVVAFIIVLVLAIAEYNVIEKLRIKYS